MKMQCKHARSAIRQLIGSKPFTSSFSKDAVIDHAEDCGGCKRGIEKSIEGGSVSYGIDFESTLKAAREAIVKIPSQREIHGTSRPYGRRK